jgi:probable rRNA maturation factor
MIWNRQRRVRVAPRGLGAFLRQVEKELRVSESEVTVCLVSDAEITRMNREFRGKRGATDVLSFPAEKKKWRVASDEWREKGVIRASVSDEGAKKRRLKKRLAQKATGETPDFGEEYLGDIAIAPAVARRYAKKNGRTLESELRVLILHGVLHLLGYDHETDHGEMERMEQKLRRRFGLA